VRCPSVPNSGQGFSISKTRLEGAGIYLTDRPAKADWLTAEQKAWLSAKLALLVLAVLPLVGGLLVFLGGHETK